MEEGKKCVRCGGLMVETYSDLLSPNEKGEDMIGWRCVNCGEYLDRQVCLNRTEREGWCHAPQSRERVRVFAQRPRSVIAHR